MFLDADALVKLAEEVGVSEDEARQVVTDKSKIEAVFETSRKLKSEGVHCKSMQVITYSVHARILL